MSKAVNVIRLRQIGARMTFSGSLSEPGAAKKLYDSSKELRKQVSLIRLPNKALLSARA